MFLLAAFGSVNSLRAQILYTQDFSTLTAGTGISGTDGVACATAGTGPAANGLAGQTIGDITWTITTPPASLPDECSFIKVVSPGGNNRLHAKNLRGLEGCFRISNISITGYQAVVSLDFGIFAGDLREPATASPLKYMWTATQRLPSFKTTTSAPPPALTTSPSIPRWARLSPALPLMWKCVSAAAMLRLLSVVC
jgi:hypothetical protein